MHKHKKIFSVSYECFSREIQFKMTSDHTFITMDNIFNSDTTKYWWFCEKKKKKNFPSLLRETHQGIADLKAVYKYFIKQYSYYMT